MSIGPPKRRIGPRNRRPTSINKQKGRQKFSASFGFLNERFTLNEIEEPEILLNVLEREFVV